MTRTSTPFARIPSAFIQALLLRTDIVDLIDTRIGLKQAGQNHKACCPFHDEKTPSFTVSAKKQFYYCFGCGASGNAISFLMAYDRLDFLEAIHQLAAKAGLVVPQHHHGDSQQSLETHLKFLAKSARFYQTQLHPLAVDYLIQRGLSKETIQHFLLGFAPPHWDNLLPFFGNNSSSKKLLLETGMLIKNARGNCYDRFRGRIMFPIRNVKGQVIGFGGRLLEEEKTQPKYLNSPETSVFHKSQELYGLFEVLNEKRKPDKLLVVEGYMDVISLFQHGINYAVATLGTAINEQHIRKLMRYTEHIIFCFDGDEAGQRAASRALEVSLPLMNDGIAIQFMFLPQHQDPDDFIRQQGVTTFNAVLTKAINITDYFLFSLQKSANLKTLEGKAKFGKLAAEKIEKIPQGIFKQLLLNRINALIGTDLTQFIQSKKNKPIRNFKKSFPHQTNQKLTPMRLCLILLLHHPKLAKNLSSNHAVFSIKLPGSEFLNQLIKVIKSQNQPTMASILEHWRGQEHENLLGKFVVQEIMVPDEQVETEFNSALEQLLRQDYLAKIDTLLLKAKKEGLTMEEIDLLKKLQREVKNKD